MEGGDIASWSSTSFIVVLEGMLAHIPESKMKTLKGKVWNRGFQPPPPPADEWDWSTLSIKQVNDYARRLNVGIDVVTFISQAVADQAAEWLSKYEIEVRSVEYADLDLFCTSLVWRDVERIVDSDRNRLMRYGQLGFAATHGGPF